MRVLIRAWTVLPVVVRSFLVGMTIQVVGVLSFGLLAQLNLAIWPGVPWSLPAELACLWLLYRYLAGAGWPGSTRELRRRRLRARPVPPRLWPATLATGTALGVSIAFQMVFAYRLVEMPEAAGGAILAFLSAPPATAIGILAAGVVMTGFVEEAAFRGYMQQPIEERHGPVPAVVLVAIAFAGVHEPPLTLLPLFVFGALGWGIYARLAGSTLPGMVVHAAVDAVAFAWIFLDPDVLPELLAASALDQGMDRATWIAAVGALVSAGATVLGFVWMARSRDAVARRPPEPVLTPGPPVAAQ